MTAKIIGKKVILPAITVLEGERLVERLEFRLSPVYEGIDLKEFNPYACIRRADGTTDKIPLSKTATDDVMCIVWQLDASATAVPGELHAHLCFENSDGTVVFMTERFAFCVRPSVDAMRDYTDRAPSAIYQLQNQMVAYVARMQQLVNEVEDKLEGVGSGGGGEVYDETNKLPSAFVDGLAPVATSGSYADLSGAPDLSLYATLADLAQKAEELKLLTAPLYFKYVSFEAPDDVFTEICNYNKAKFKEYLQTGIYVRPAFLWVTETDAYYPLYYSFSNETQIDLMFRKGNSTYSVSYCPLDDSFGFSE